MQFVATYLNEQLVLAPICTKQAAANGVVTWFCVITPQTTCGL